MGVDRYADDYEFVDDVAAALRGWLGTHDRAAQVEMVAVRLADVGDPADPLVRTAKEIRLHEVPAQELADLLRVDATARRGKAPADDDDEVDQLRYAAARLAVLLDERRGHAADTPPEAIAVLAELARAVSAVSALAGYAAAQVVDGLRRGEVVPRRGVAGDVAALVDGLDITTAAVRHTLGEVAVTHLESMQQQLASLDHRAAVLAAIGGTDEPTLTRAVVVECAAGGFGMGRYHARLFTPPGGGRPLIVLGDLADNRSTGIMNYIERLAAIVADKVLHIGLDEAHWAGYIPAQRIGNNREMIGLVDPTWRTSSNWRPIRPDRLEDLAGGPVRRWHARDYTSTKLTAAGVPAQTVPRTPRTASP